MPFFPSLYLVTGLPTKWSAKKSTHFGDGHLNCANSLSNPWVSHNFSTTQISPSENSTCSHLL